MNEIFQLTGKKAVITGSGSGIGRAIAHLFASRGAEVFIVDFDEKAALTVAGEIKDAGGYATAVNCDVTQQEVVKKLFAQIGTIDILVNSAGISHIGKAENTSEEDFDRVFNVNVKGVYNCLLAAIPTMKETKKGVILNITSIANHAGIPDRFAYSASKGAVYAMTLSTAKDYINDGIRCNCISPARVHTPFVDAFLKKNYPGREQEIFDKLSKTQPIGRMAEPGEVAYLALYLCSDEASFVTGCDYPFDGGFINLNN